MMITQIVTLEDSPFLHLTRNNGTSQTFLCFRNISESKNWYSTSECLNYPPLEWYSKTIFIEVITHD